MKNNETRDKIIFILEEEGIFIYNNDFDNDDVNLTNYIEDSLQFISIIVQFEEVFNIDIPNELLIYDSFESLNYICEIIESMQHSI